MIFCLFRVAIFLSETLMQSFTVCVMIGVSRPTDIWPISIFRLYLFSVFICVLFYFFSFRFNLYPVYDFHNNNNNNNVLNTVGRSVCLSVSSSGEWRIKCVH